MKKYSWIDVFVCRFPALKEIREREGLIIPEEYLDLDYKMRIFIFIYSLLIGISLSLGLIQLGELI